MHLRGAARGVLYQDQLLQQVAACEGRQQESASDYDWSDAVEGACTADAGGDGSDSGSVHNEPVEVVAIDTLDTLNRHDPAACREPASNRRGEYARGMDVPQYNGGGLCDCDLLGRKCTCADQQRLPPQEKNGQLYHKVRNILEGHCLCRIYQDKCVRPWTNAIVFAVVFAMTHN
jgi:hypothetical protein